MGDPQVARPARARPDPDRVPVVRARQRRRADARRGGRGAPARLPEHFEVAVLGCAVNGPGESGDADFGIAGGRDDRLHLRARQGAAQGRVGDARRRALPRDRRWIAAGMQRPERRKHAKPAALAMAEASRSRSTSPRYAPRIACLATMIARASQLFLPTLRDAPADAEARQPQAARARRLHPPGHRAASGRSAARLARAPQGRADHPRGDGRDRRAGDARAGATPVELWEATRPRQDPGALPARGPRGRDYVLPMTHEETFTFHARELQSYRQLPQSWYHFQTKDRDEPRPRGGLHPRPRVHHEGLLLVRPRRGGARDELPRTRGAYHRIFQRCGLEYHAVQAESGMMGGSESIDFLAPVGLGREHARHLRERRLRGRHRGRPRRSACACVSAAPRRAGGDRDARRHDDRGARRRRSASTSPRPRRRCRSRRTTAAVVLALVRGDDRLELDKLDRRARRGRPARDRGRDPRCVRRRARLARPGRLRGRDRRRRDAARRAVRRRREPRRLASARRRGRPRLRAAVRRHPRAARRATRCPSAAARSRSRPRSRSATSSSSARATRCRSTRRSSTRTVRRSRW